MKICVLHGFNVKDGGTRSTDRLMAPLSVAGHNPCDWDYGWVGFLGVRLFTGQIAKRVAKRIIAERPDVIVGHSNGCNVIMKALRRLEKLDKEALNRIHRVVLISPALDRDTPYPSIDRGRVHVFHTREDDVVKFADLLLFHPWGSMGAHGATRAGFVNHDFSSTVWDHSDWFTGCNLRATVHKILEVIR